MSHPYQDLPAEAFWRSAVAEPAMDEITGLWQPKWPLQRSDRIVTAGSCFAQHIGRALSQRGYGWTDYEPAPPLLSQEEAARFNYGIFSFRTGNIYTARMLNQWLDLALDGAEGPPPVPLETGRLADPLRPLIEPEGFSHEAEFYAARAATAAAIGRAVREASLFVFTLGLTECWRDAQTGLEFAACPGTLAGTFEPARHHFHNMGFAEVFDETGRAIDRMRAVNPGLRVLLTVSPVPLTATASGSHVLTATTRSKATLRAAAAELSETRAEVDYFPSYEIITAPPFRGRAFAKNKRSVKPKAVNHVMNQFFADQRRSFPELFDDVDSEAEQRAQRQRVRQARRANRAREEADDVVCEEAMLDAFSR